MTDLTYTVPNLACSACVETVTATIRQVDEDAVVRADPQTKQVHVELSAPNQGKDAALRQAMSAAGYPPAV